MPAGGRPVGYAPTNLHRLPAPPFLTSFRASGPSGAFRMHGNERLHMQTYHVYDVESNKRAAPTTSRSLTLAPHCPPCRCGYLTCIVKLPRTRNPQRSQDPDIWACSGTACSTLSQSSPGILEPHRPPSPVKRRSPQFRSSSKKATPGFGVKPAGATSPVVLDDGEPSQVALPHLYQWQDMYKMASFYSATYMPREYKRERVRITIANNSVCRGHSTLEWWAVNSFGTGGRHNGCGNLNLGLPPASLRTRGEATKPRLS
ncbi:hypothetical protein N658DRAFT_196393 [Parathielavia hyrcaniae]|uniref:Uncharacterized protein n=1 Tax=Parathielavia hyrcaniae TaxID=113614 RepID=A0AAN6Q8P2_9PEZI|nr:hypothetical protein N658DRAFT_196393 [Parathielavia hyrcaniae]